MKTSRTVSYMKLAFHNYVRCCNSTYEFTYDFTCKPLISCTCKIIRETKVSHICKLLGM